MDGNQSSDGQPELPPVQPGQTFSPGGTTSAAPPAPAQPVPAAEATPVAPTEPVQPAVVPQETAPSQPQTPISMTDPNTAAPDVGFDASTDQSAMSAPTTEHVSWTASEFIAHEKSGSWYLLLIGGAVAAAVVVWFITKDIVSSVVIILAVSILAAYARRTPRELQYILDDHGITIGEKHYPYASFRSFSVIEEGPFSSIELLPLKRFSPPISVYYDPANEEAIADALVPHLPFQPRKQDAVDRLMRRIRF